MNGSVKMVNYLDMLNAVNRVLGWREGIPMTQYEQKLSETLETYKLSGVFDGTMESAKECLEMAGYELDQNVLKFYRSKEWKKSKISHQN
jgi:hypothetical protein